MCYVFFTQGIQFSQSRNIDILLNTSFFLLCNMGDLHLKKKKKKVGVTAAMGINSLSPLEKQLIIHLIIKGIRSYVLLCRINGVLEFNFL